MTQTRTAGSRCHMNSICQWSLMWYSTTQACLHSPVPNTKCLSPAVFQPMTQHYPLEEGAGMEPLWLLILSVCSSVSSHIIFLYVNHIILVRVHRISLALLYLKNVDIVETILRPVACFLVNLLNVKAWTNVSFFWMNLIHVYKDVLWGKVVFLHYKILFLDWLSALPYICKELYF